MTAVRLEERIVNTTNSILLGHNALPVEVSIWQAALNDARASGRYIAAS